MMNCKFSAAAVILTLSLLLSGTARAMQMHDFAKMNDDDEATYVALLVDGAAKTLRAHGHPDQAQKAIDLFKDTSKNSGTNQFAMKVKELNAKNNRNAINPNNRAPVYQIEDAMSQTLKDNEIIISTSELLAINHDFQPVGPPRSHLLSP
jgi:hypothetical protein